MNETSRALSVVAYYLSEFDMGAVQRLGYSTRSEAIKQISIRLERDNNYLKLRRDEFDALPTSSSHRRGWVNRSATRDVVELANYLRAFSFDDLSEIVKALLERQSSAILSVLQSESTLHDILPLTEEEIEQLLNFTDTSAQIRLRTMSSKVRVYNANIIGQLKKLYHGKCQLCGFSPFGDSNICEAHHIEYFSKSQNNDANNIIIVCPNHHRLIHRYCPKFDHDKKEFIYLSSKVEKLILNYHL